MTAPRTACRPAAWQKRRAGKSPAPGACSLRLAGRALAVLGGFSLLCDRGRRPRLDEVLVAYIAGEDGPADRIGEGARRTVPVLDHPGHQVHVTSCGRADQCITELTPEFAEIVVVEDGCPGKQAEVR